MQSRSLKQRKLKKKHLSQEQNVTLQSLLTQTENQKTPKVQSKQRMETEMVNKCIRLQMENSLQSSMQNVLAGEIMAIVLVMEEEIIGSDREAMPVVVVVVVEVERISVATNTELLLNASVRKRGKFLFEIFWGSCGFHSFAINLHRDRIKREAFQHELDKAKMVLFAIYTFLFTGKKGDRRHEKQFAEIRFY